MQIECLVRISATALALLVLAPVGAAAQGPPLGADRVFRGRSEPQDCWGRPCPEPPDGVRFGRRASGALFTWDRIHVRGWSPAETVQRAPAAPAPRAGRAAATDPGALHLVYMGALDSEGDVHGLGVRAALALLDVIALELSAGGLGGSQSDGSSRLELPVLAGIRVQVPVRVPLARFYGVAATGVLLRTTPHRADPDPIAIFPLQIGAGMEIGFPIAPRLAVGVVFDVRLDVRVPIGDLPASAGPAWSGGLALSWY